MSFFQERILIRNSNRLYFTVNYVLLQTWYLLNVDTHHYTQRVCDMSRCLLKK